MKPTIRSLKEDKTLNQIINILINNEKLRIYKLNKIILFGSRARGDYHEYSDYDILVIINNNIDNVNRFQLEEDIVFDLSNLNIYCDILIRTDNEVKERVELIGNAIRYDNPEKEAFFIVSSDGEVGNEVNKTQFKDWLHNKKDEKKKKNIQKSGLK